MASDPKTPEPAAESTDQQQVAVKPLTVADLKELAHNYHVPMSDATLEHIVGDSKEISPQKAVAFEDYLKTTAAGLFPTLAPQIRAGIPTAFLLDPYRQVGKQVLGSEFEPNFQTDHTDRAALFGHTDPATGRAVPMSLEQWQTHLKSAPKYGYQATPQGQQETADMRQKLVEAMSQGGSE